MYRSILIIVVMLVCCFSQTAFGRDNNYFVVTDHEGNVLEFADEVIYYPQFEEVEINGRSIFRPADIDVWAEAGNIRFDKHGLWLVFNIYNHGDDGLNGTARRAKKYIVGNIVYYRLTAADVDEMAHQYGVLPLLKGHNPFDN